MAKINNKKKIKTNKKNYKLSGGNKLNINTFISKTYTKLDNNIQLNNNNNTTSELNLELDINNLNEQSTQIVTLLDSTTGISTLNLFMNGNITTDAFNNL